MVYNPITHQLFADDGSFIKTLHCPLNKQWEDLNSTITLKARLCDSCNKQIYDSALLKENELINLIKNDPHTCIKIDLNQENIYLTHQTYVEQ